MRNCCSSSVIWVSIGAIALLWFSSRVLNTSGKFWWSIRCAVNLSDPCTISDCSWNGLLCSYR